MTNDIYASIECALVKRDVLTNKAADEATEAIKKATSFLLEKGITQFSYLDSIDVEVGTNEDVNVFPISVGLLWYQGKILMEVDGEHEPALGLNRQKRIQIHQDFLGKFLERALFVVENSPLYQDIAN